MMVDYTPEALVDLAVIWDWNARTYGKAHADGFIEFLRRETDRLETGIRSWPHRAHGFHITLSDD